jgi:NDP-sugar pyrophosphorylase family protein
MNPSEMKVAILCGGLGTRLGPLTADKPKSLVEVAGEPFLAHQLRLLRLAGLTKIVLLCGHKGAMLWNEFGSGKAHGVDLEYSFDGALQSGTGGAIVNALPVLGEAFYVLYGDTYLQIDYQAAGAVLHQNGCTGVMAVGEASPGNVEVDAEGEWVTTYAKPPSESMVLTDAGLMAFRKRAFAPWISRKEAFDLAEVQADLALKVEMAAFICYQRFYEIGSPAGLRELNDLLRPTPR